jgi:transposase-like protein
MKNTSKRYSPEIQERAVRLVFDHQAEYPCSGRRCSRLREIGCTHETLRRGVRRAERDQGKRPGATTDERERLKALERENAELRRANEILRRASAFFAQAELDRRGK